MRFVRIGDKLVDKDRIADSISRILELRQRGLSQVEVSEREGVDRSFVSRLESLGEVRKGARIAVVGFPVGNKEEIIAIAQRHGVDFVLVLNDRERWAYLEGRTGADVFNELLAILARLNECDAIVFMGSDKRVELAESLLGNRVVGVRLGSSPIVGDRHVDPTVLEEIIEGIARGEGQKSGEGQKT